MEREVRAYCREETAGEIERIAREHDLSEQEVVRQLLELGLEALS
jgi:2-iminoacetate synthase ThiH